MILGIGTDIVSITRLEKAVNRSGEAFLERVFTDKERQAADKLRQAGSRLAGRWAAKEALAKALGCGIGEHCSWQDIEILNDASGRPVMTLRGAAEAQFKRLNGRNLHLSISHEENYATAVVIIEG